MSRKFLFLFFCVIFPTFLVANTKYPNRVTHMIDVPNDISANGDKVMQINSGGTSFVFTEPNSLGITSVGELTELNVSGDVQVTGNISSTGTIGGLTQAELGELGNVDSETISNTQWGYLGELDQSLVSTQSVTFDDVYLVGRSPSLFFVDDDTDDNDNSFSIDANATAFGTGAENVDVDFKAQSSGSMVTFFAFDADGNLSITPAGAGQTNITSGDLNMSSDSDISVSNTAILSDSSGTMTLSNVDALDSTTETTVENAIDTLSNLTAASSLVTVGTIGTGTWQATDVEISHGGTGASSASIARTNLGVAIGSDVQAWNENLDDISAISTADSNIIVGDGAKWVAESGSTARTSLGVAIGSDVQAWDTILDDISAISTADGNILVGDGSTLVAESGNTARTSIGVGDSDSVEHSQLGLGESSPSSALHISKSQPTITMTDTDTTDNDDNFVISVNATEAGTATEDVDVQMLSQRNGTLSEFFHNDADGDVSVRTFSGAFNIKSDTAGQSVIQFFDSDDEDGVDGVVPNGAILVDLTDTTSGNQASVISIFAQSGGSVDQQMTMSGVGDISVFPAQSFRVRGAVDYKSSDSENAISAGTGITSAMIDNFTIIDVAGDGGPVDVTANPQIANGNNDGQIIYVMGGSDTNTVKLDDEDGLNLTGSMTLGNEDVLQLIYNDGSSTWVEISRSDN